MSLLVCVSSLCKNALKRVYCFVVVTVSFFFVDLHVLGVWCTRDENSFFHRAVAARSQW